MGWGEGHHEDEREVRLSVQVPDLSRLEDRLDRIDYKLGVLLRGLLGILNAEENEMSEIDDLRAGQAATNEAITRLGVSAANAATRVLAKLDELVAAEGNQVTEADVADIRDDALALQDIAGQIDAIAPADATPPPVETPPVETPPVETPPVPEPQPVDGDGNPIPAPADVPPAEPVADTPVA